MHGTMRRTAVRALAVVALAAGALVAPVTSSGAAPEPISFTVTGGQIAFAGQSVDIPPGGVLSGTWDAVTGTFNGSLTFGQLTLPVDASAANLGVIDLTFDVQPGPVTGTVPADGSPGTLSSDFNITITAVTPLPFTCSLGPISFNLTATLSGTTLNASQDGFVVPVLPASDTCGVASAASGLLGLPSSDSSASLSFRLNSGAAPAAVTGSPLFTG
jgi:hypothetical protein